MQVSSPKYVIIYNGKDITGELTEHVTNVTYTDKTIGESDELEFNVEDVAALWRNNWYPTKGDKIVFKMGNQDSLVTCGEFTIDEVEANGPPDVITIRALATTNQTSLRTKSSRAYEGQTIKQIVESVAKRNKLTVNEGKNKNNSLYKIRIERSTQYNESDLAYLNRICGEYGFIFSVKGSQLIVYSILDVESGNAVLAIKRSDLKSYSLKDKTSFSANKAQVNYHNPKNKSAIEFIVDTVKNLDGIEFPVINETASADNTIKIKSKAENRQQAEAKATIALYKSKTQQVEGTLSVIGNIILLAGNNIELEDMGQLSGKYHIMQSAHTFEKQGGYQTTVTVKRIGFVQLVKHKSTKPRKAPKYDVEIIK